MLYAFGFLVFLILALLGLGYWLAGRLLRPPRLAVARTPAERGLAFEDITFPSKDGMQLKGWWIPGSRGATSQSVVAPTVVLLHPLFGNRLGTSDVWPCSRSPRDVLDLLTVAEAFHAAGFAALLFDFRQHGASPAGVCSGGYTEDQDVVGAVDYAFGRLAAADPDRPPRVGLVGYGLGAAAAISAIGREKGDDRTIRIFSSDNEGATGMLEFRPANVKKLRFLVAVEPASPGAWLYDRLRNPLSPLVWVLVSIVGRFYRVRSGYPLDAALLLKFARHVYTPSLYLTAQAAGSRSYREVQLLFDAMPGPKQIRCLEGGPGPTPAGAGLDTSCAQALAFAQQQLGAGDV